MNGKYELQRPMFGSNYYPEAWDSSEIDKDLDKMVEMGLNCVRIAEFAWGFIQTDDDVYDLSLFREVVDKCKERNIAVIMGTPSAIPPRWMEKKHPEMLVVDMDGKRLKHGGGRHICPNSEIYRDYLAKVVEKMAIEFGKDENIIGWQMDNEMEPQSHAGKVNCCCDTCASKFRERMRKMYDNDIEKLNREWGTHIRGMRFDCFEDIGAPNYQLHHPAFSYHWGLFANDSLHEVLELQHNIIHKYSDKPTGHCSMPHFQFEHEKLRSGTDVMQLNQYYYKTTYGDEAYADSLVWYNLLYNLKDKPFWLTETSTCWNGGTAGAYMRPKNFCRMNVWNSYLRGAELVDFWLWRSHYGGNELMHGAVINSCGRENQTSGEVRQLGKDLSRLSDVITNTSINRSEIAIHTSFASHQIFRFQPMSPTFNYRWHFTNAVYQPIEQMHYSADLIVPSKELDRYKVVITPFMPTLHEDNLSERVLKWVENGGTWIAGPMTDIRNASGSKYTDKAMGMLEDITDCRLEYTLVRGADYSIVFEDGSRTKTIDEVYEVYSVEPSGKNTKVLARYDGEMADNMVAITETPYGKGRIIILGAMPSADGWKKFLSDVLTQEDIHPVSEASETVALTARSGEAGEIFSAVELMRRSGAYACVPFDGDELLTGKTFKKGEKVELEPYGVMIVKKK
ncbi:MAG: beta-galactosidase [Clostridia bacterium]|nr:beta-galactosidase [Clostridia bacterium]